MASNSKNLGEPKVALNISRHEWMDLLDYEKRHLYLYGAISNFDDEDYSKDEKLSISDIVRWIMRYNTEDFGKPTEERHPIYLYINCPGGDIYEGWPLISAIELSKTPVYTVNIGMWASMAFHIGITGHKRFSLPNMTFLMHDGRDGIINSTSKVLDEAEFLRLYETEVTKKHVLKYSKVGDAEYESLKTKEYYFLPGTAIEHGFIDKIVTDLDEILDVQPTLHSTPACVPRSKLEVPRPYTFGDTIKDLKMEQSELH